MDPLLSKENRLIKTRNLLKSNDPELSKIKKELQKTLKFWFELKYSKPYLLLKY